MDKVFTWRNSDLSYRIYGSGSKSLIAFHGYGQSKEVFKDLVDVFGSEYQVVACDLPFHGKTIWRESEAIQDHEIYALSQEFLTHLNIDKKFTVLGYSIGGNFALALTAAFPTRVDSLWLLAADGLRFKPGFWFITRTILGRWFFNGFINFPRPVFFLIRLLHRLKVYPDKLVQFFMNNIDSKEKRKAIYKRWRSVSVMLRKNRFIWSQINSQNIPVKMFFGRFDKIIPVRNAIRFSKPLNKVNLVILEDGHQILNKKTYTKMKEVL